MAVIAQLRNLHIAPRKVRLVAELVKGKSAEEAAALLNFAVKRAAKPILKLLNSAVANAKNNFQLDSNNLYISKITVDEGPKMKRWMPRARGSASEIQKKTSHIYLVLDEINKKAVKAEKVQRVEKLEEASNVDRAPKLEKPRLKQEVEIKKPKIEKGIKRIFRRKAF